MTQPLLERRSPVGLTYALLILTVFFFFVPSAFRAARLSLGQKENNVKDWLPSDFPETSELKWFEKHFAGESFVVATWPGCTSGCLLYTSPSPRDQRGSRMPSSA